MAATTRASIAATLLFACCTSKGTVGVPANLPETDITVPMHANGKVDLLFMVDNSPSMDGMQSQMRAHFPDLLHALTQLARGPYDLHIGVVTSDYGAGDTTGGGCAASPGGDNGRLQAIGAAAATGCQAPTNAPFIQYAVDKNGAVTANNLPAGQTVEQTFTCMASVGSGGCGFEHQLESVYAALHGDAVSSGFLRDDAALTVVFLTNEDDGSAAPTAKFYEQAADPNVFGAYDTFRQTRFAVDCGGKPIPYGSASMLSACAAAPNPMSDPNLAYDVGRYTSFFGFPKTGGGVKNDPSDVALVAIAPPAAPTQTLLVQKGTGLGRAPNPTYVPCGPSLSANCIERLQHSCQNVADPTFFGDPAVRLASVVESAALHQLVSICGDDPNAEPDYGQAMSGVGQLMASQAIGGCLFRAPVDLAHPSCRVSVGDVSTQTIPAFSAGESSYWQITNDPSCPVVRDIATGGNVQLRLTVVGVDPSLPVHAVCHVYKD